MGTAQVPGRMGAQGHGWAAPRPAGGSEDRGPQRAPRPWAANAFLLSRPTRREARKVRHISPQIF